MQKIGDRGADRGGDHAAYRADEIRGEVYRYIARVEVRTALPQGERERSKEREHRDQSR